MKNPRRGKRESSNLRKILGCLGGVLALWVLAFVYTVILSSSMHSQPKDVLIEEWEASLDQYIAGHASLSYQHQGERKLVEEGPYFKLGSLIGNWNPDDTADRMWKRSAAHPDKGHSLPRFNFMNRSEARLAKAYERASLPFVLYNVPELDNAASKQGGFSSAQLASNFGQSVRTVERSNDNHFVYYHKYKTGGDEFPEWTPPQRDMHITLQQFKAHAVEAGKQNLLNTANLRSLKTPLHYMTINADEGRNTPWITEALPFFDVEKFKPSSDAHFSFIKDPDTYHGINCRFGMRGIVASAHFDSKDNFIAMVRGRKRYIILPPSECDSLDLLPKNHPSARHSKLDWSSPETVSANDALRKARATEVILRMGEILFLPAYWFHYIVSQDASIQCNCRSGDSQVGERSISRCMQHVAEREARRREGVERQPMSSSSHDSNRNERGQNTAAEAEVSKSFLFASNGNTHYGNDDKGHGHTRRERRQSSYRTRTAGGNSMADAAAMLDSMAHSQGLDLHPDHHYHANNNAAASSSQAQAQAQAQERRGPRTRKNEFGSDQRDLHMDSGADLQLEHIMNFGEE